MWHTVRFLRVVLEPRRPTGSQLKLVLLSNPLHLPLLLLPLRSGEVPRLTPRHIFAMAQIKRKTFSLSITAIKASNNNNSLKTAIATEREGERDREGEREGSPNWTCNVQCDATRRGQRGCCKTSSAGDRQCCQLKTKKTSLFSSFFWLLVNERK